MNKINLFLPFLFLTSCFRYNDISSFALEKTDQIIECIENKDASGLKSMFSKHVQNRLDVLDSQIQELFSYFKGTYESLDAGGVGSLTDMEYGVIVDVIDFAYEIHTSETNYLFACNIYRRDDTNENNVGIWYLWLDEYQDGEEPQSIGSWDNYNVGITLM